jgi:mono/diheme cytochrome c family protein
MAGLRAFTVIAALLAVLHAPAFAQDNEEGEPELGLLLAKYWCNDCHYIGQGSRASDIAPPFPAIAANPLKPDDYLRTWLTDPHYPMPKLDLSRREIDHLIAYFGSLRLP